MYGVVLRNTPYSQVCHANEIVQSCAKGYETEYEMSKNYSLCLTVFTIFTSNEIGAVDLHS